MQEEEQTNEKLIRFDLVLRTDQVAFHAKAHALLFVLSLLSLNELYDSYVAIK